MKKVSGFMKGKKTYTMAALMVIYAILGIFLKELDTQESVRLLMIAGGFTGLRSAK